MQLTRSLVEYVMGDDTLINALQFGGVKRGIKYGLYNAIQPIETRFVRPTVLKLPYYVAKHRLIAKHYQQFWIRRGIGQKLSFDELAKQKTSDTIFILGSGPSINEITEYQWNLIDGHDSMGLNRWPIHEYVPTYFIFELSKSRLPFNQSFIDLIHSRADDYTNVPIILKNHSHIFEKVLTKVQIPDWLRDSVRLGVDTNFGTLYDIEGSREDNQMLLKYLEHRGFFDRGHIDLLYKKRGSISFLLTLACILGYDKVVLCGVDMSTNGHFWDSKDYESLQCLVPSIPRSQRQPEYSKSHKTVEVSEGRLTLDKVIEDMVDIVLKSKNINLELQGESTKLYPKYPIYDW